MQLNESAVVAAATETFPERNAIVVLGMHRSGTSALTRVISLLGAGLPKRLLGAHQSNERGHWEPDHLVALHDRMLGEIGSRWDDWRSWNSFPVGEDKLAHYRSDIRRVLQEEYKEASLFVLKDPRICRLVPLYEDVFSEMGAAVSYVIPVRNPLAVIASLRERDGMTDGFAALLWLRHVLDAEYTTRGKARFFTTYEELMADWRGVVDKMEETFAFDWPVSVESASENIREHLAPDLQHHVFDEKDISGVGNFGAWLKDTYTALLNLSRNRDEANFIVLDRVRRSFEGFAAQAGAVVFPELRRRESGLWAEINSQRERADAEQNRTAHVQQLLEVEKHRAEAELGQAASETKRAEAENLRAETERQRADTEQKRAALLQQILEAQEKRTEAERQRADTEQKRAAHLQQMLELQEKRTEAELQRADTEAQAVAGAREALDSERSERLKAAGERDLLAAEADSLRSRLKEAEERLEAARQELEGTRQEVAALRNSASWRITAPLRAIKTALS